ncbi:YfaZ family outer membrane protein [Halomonas alkalicola]|uniref:YfaZ family outer membrane protein n=2 Tax=Halomonadaceae TaxID=28256 RepID=A0ABY9H147_9GAMM|nr:YfaZ family outer membrane protein [Halomonas alkalicola]WLI72181.1 YfaZ family outer membrane protein [Halomonas alkalicola]
MKKHALIAAAATVAAMSQQAHALSLGATVGENSYSIQGTQRIVPGLHAGAGYYSSDDSGGDARAYSGSLMFTPYTPLVDVSFGARYQYLDTDYGDGGNLGVSGSAYIPTTIPRLSLGGYAHYFPSALSHGDVDESYEYGANLRFRVLGNSFLTGGYRYYKADFDGDGGGSRRLESGWVMGVSVGF